jgi:hypothetical protein
MSSWLGFIVLSGSIIFGSIGYLIGRPKGRAGSASGCRAELEDLAKGPQRLGPPRSPQILGRENVDSASGPAYTVL